MQLRVKTINIPQVDKYSYLLIGHVMCMSVRLACDGRGRVELDYTQCTVQTQRQAMTSWLLQNLTTRLSHRGN